MKQMNIEQRTIDASIDQCHSRLKTTHVPKADILTTWRKLASVEKKQRSNILHEHLL